VATTHPGNRLQYARSLAQREPQIHGSILAEARN
jgi:hypothetical protein